MIDCVSLRFTELVTRSKCHGGQQLVVRHKSKELDCAIKFSVFLPSSYGKGKKLPIVYFLSGLTCTEENFIAKSGFQQHAEKYGIVVVGPDTSPRDTGIPGEKDAIDYGEGASFYVDATQEPWSKHYKMYSYVTKELREVVEKEFPEINVDHIGISGHSMGGHGALLAFLKNPEIYKAVTAFAPVCNITQAPRAQRALPAYLGNDKSTWLDYDPTEIVKRCPRKSTKIVIDQGTQDLSMPNLMPENFIEACKEAGQPLEYRVRDGYDHNYFFVQTFIAEHFKYFSEVLK